MDSIKIGEPQTYGAHRSARWPDAFCKGNCWKCGRKRQLYACGTPNHPWYECGTCLHRSERRTNTREMWGRGRRGY